MNNPIRTTMVHDTQWETHSPQVDSCDVYHWPEFQAFAKRLGIDWTARTVNLTIRLGLGKMVDVIHEFRARDPEKPDAPVYIIGG